MSHRTVKGSCPTFDNKRMMLKKQVQCSQGIQRHNFNKIGNGSASSTDIPNICSRIKVATHWPGTSFNHFMFGPWVGRPWAGCFGGAVPQGAGVPGLRVHLGSPPPKAPFVRSRRRTRGVLGRTDGLKPRLRPLGIGGHHKRMHAETWRRGVCGAASRVLTKSQP